MGANHYVLRTFIAGLLIVVFYNAQSQCTVTNAGPRSFNFPASGGGGSVSVQTSPLGCTDFSVSQVGTFFSASRSGSSIIISCNANTTTFTRTGRVNAGEIVIQVSQAAACPSQGQPGPIAGVVSVCRGAAATYSTASVSGAARYIWSVNNGGIVESGQNSLSAVIRFANNGTTTVSVVAQNACGTNSGARTFAVTAQTNSSVPTSISHNPNLCIGNNYTFAASHLAGYTYEWIVDGSGWSLDGGQGTSSINVRIGQGTGTIRVKSISSLGCKSAEFTKQVTGVGGGNTFTVTGGGPACAGGATTILLGGSSIGQTYTAYRNDIGISGESSSAVIQQSGNGSSLTFGPFTQEGIYTVKATAPGGACLVLMNGSVNFTFLPAAPDKPGTITPSGSTTLCENTSQVYSIAAVPRATNYNWSVTGGTVASGQGTTSATIVFAIAGSRSVSVTASNSCGTSAANSLSVTVVAPPSTPTNISYNPNLCIGENRTFSVTHVAGITYQWTVEGSGWLLQGGQGSSSINVKIGTGSATIKVRASNSTNCKSAEYSTQISSVGSAALFDVSGQGSICPGTSTTIILGGSVSGYAYTAYRDNQVVSGEGPSAVILKNGTGSSLTFGPFTQEGRYTIKADYGGYCAVQMNGHVDLVFKPAVPGQPEIPWTAATSVCENGLASFSVNPVPRATSYTWTVLGGTVASGQGTATAQIQFNAASAGTGTVTVAAVNACGTGIISLARQINVTSVAQPIFQATAPSPCAGGKYTFRVNPIAGNSYTWIIPAGWEILGGQGTSSIGVLAGRYDGTVEVTPSRNGCNGPKASLFVDLIQPPGVFGLTGSRVICEGQSFLLNLSGSVTGVSYTLMRGETSVEVKNGTNTALTFGPYTIPGTYKVFSSSSGSCIYPMDGEAVITAQTLSTSPTSINASAIETCSGRTVVLNVNGGVLGSGASWKWYTGACSGTLIGTGSKIAVKPLVNTTYYVKAEGSCNVTTCATVLVNVVSCPDRNYNYVHTLSPQHPGYSTIPVTFLPENVESQYEYFDFLGRTSQHVTEKSSPSRKDGFNINVYDQFGREELQYLPATATANAGLPIVDPQVKVATFYDPTAATHPLDVASTSAPYSKISFEPSPLNRPLKQGSAGESWQPDSNPYLTSADHAVKLAYESNVAGEVLKWTYTPNTTSLGLVNAGTSAARIYYAENTLVKSKTKDEDQHEVIEFKNSEGRVILKQVQTNTAELAQTYYIYDNFDQLVCVLPPEAVKGIVKTSSEYLGLSDAIKETFLARWAFRYTHDSRGRITRKQVPGASLVYMVYDKRDRIVLTQDGNQRTDASGNATKKEWTFTKYDALDRPVQSGIYTHATVINQADMQLHVNGEMNSGNQFYEDYNGVAASEGYTNRVFPVSSTNILSVTYYDNYSFRSLWTGPFAYINDELNQVRNGVTYSQPAAANSRVIGKVTGIKTKVLDGSNNWLKSVTYYDDRYRLVQTINENHKGGVDRVSNLFDFVGKILMTKTTHSTSIPTNRAVTRRFTYDHDGRLVEIWHKIDAFPEVRLIFNKYNELGQLVDKKLHSTEPLAANAKQSVDYRYNIRGWLTSLNNSTLTIESSTNDEVGDYFGMNLGYHADIGVTNSGLFNGNITGVKWGNLAGSSVGEKAYVYSYDVMSRLTGAVFKEKGLPGWVTPANNANVETGITYDLNGNIQGLTRNDKRPSNAGTMDILVYNYGAPGATSNRLLKIADSGDKAKGFIDGTNTVDDYTYDANGNMITDQNKGITSPIGYNYLNLPQTISRGQNTITYVYDASGRKLAQRATFGNVTRQTDYLGEFVYEGNALQFITHDEGRAVVAATELIYTHACGSSSGLVTYNAVSPLTNITQNGGETYVKATSNGTTARSGIFPIGGTFTVAPGERYKIRVKGYRDKGTAASSSSAHLLIRINGTDLNWPGATLPSSSASAQTESWIEQTITVPAGATTQSLQVGVVWNSVLSGEVIYLNDFEITRLSTSAPAYQYHIKDHLGNVRLTFTTVNDPDQSLATMESANVPVERSQFLYYDEAVKVNSPLFDHTHNAAPGGTANVAGVNISPVTLILTVGKTGQLTHVVVPSNASNQTVAWTSSNTAVATVSSSGIVTGVAPGTAIIIVSTSSGNFTASSTVTVTAASSGTTFYRAINLNGTAFTIDGNNWEAGSSAPNFSYTNGNTFANQNVTLNPPTDAARATMIRSSIWGSSNINVGAVPNGTYAIYVYVWEDNNPATFSFSIEGTIAQSNYNSGTAGSWAKLGPFIRTITDGAINVSVSGAEASLSGLEIWNHNGPSQIDVTGVSVSSSTMSVNVGSSTQLATIITPANATNQSITWLSNNTAVATINPAGLITAVAPGTATITARSVSNTSVSGTSTITINAAPASTIPLIALKFNENSGTSPASAGSLTGTTFTSTSNTPAWTSNVPATVGGASALDFGTTAGNYVVESGATIDGLKNLSAFTLTGWLNCKNSTVGSGGNRIISWINGGGNGVDLVYRTDGSLRLGVNAWPDASPAFSSSNKITTNASAPASNWVFFAVTYQSSNGQVQFYFGNNEANATLDITRTYSQGAVGSNIARLAIGHFNSVTRSAAPDRMFRGLIDDIQIYGSVLTPAQIVSVQRNSSTTNPVAVTNVTVAPSAPILTLGGTTTVQLAAAILPLNATNGSVTWASSNTAIATVNATGVVTALSPGSSVISARSVSNASIAGTSNVTVNAASGGGGGAVTVTGVTVSPTSVTLASGQTRQLTITIAPSNAANQNVGWISSNPAVATVNSAGLVTAISTGTAAIICTSIDGGYIATTDVTVNASGSTTYYATRLTGTPSETYGLAKSLSVMPGDVITAEVFAKYLDANRSNSSATLNNFITAIAAGIAPSGTFVDGGAAGSLGGGALPIAPIDHANETGADPKAYLNYIIFDKNMSSTPLGFGFKRLSMNFREYGQDGPHQRLAFDGAEQIKITEPGFVYIYLSNENGTPLEVYFDDFKVTHTKTPIVQQDDYYPFGLTFNSHQRENMLTSDIKYNSKEAQNELGIHWLDYGARMYLPEIGRWTKVDALSDSYEGVSPYCYALNDPINAIDPDGNLIVFVNGFMKDQWLNQNNGPAYKATPYGLVPDPGTPNPNYRPYPGERTFSTGAPTYLGQPFEYWGNEYNDNAGIGGVFSQIYNDYNTLFISASAGSTSQAKDRFQEGITAANDLIRQLENGEVTLEDDETIKIIGHSHGAAFAAGMVSVLAKHKKYSLKLEVVHYLSPHQPKDFKHAAKILGYQWTSRSDLVSSLWFSPLQLVNGRSRYGQIEGIDKENFTVRKIYPVGFGGHFADTWIFNLVRWAQTNGIPVTVYK